MKVENINEASLSEVERNALAILRFLTDRDLAALKHSLYLGVPAAIGVYTLRAAVALFQRRGFDLTTAGVSAFKRAAGLGDSGADEGAIGKQTAAAYFAALTILPPEPAGPRRVNAAGLDLIRRYEGLRLTAYLCPAGVWTIGYGHTGDVQPGQTITRERADELLRADLRNAEGAVSRLIRVPLSDNEFSALVSFAFNCGIGALEGSTLRRHLNGGLRLAAAGEFWRWCYGGGRRLEGLVRRRADERALFLKR